MGRAQILCRLITAGLLACVTGWSAGCSKEQPIVVGSKNFTEQSILGELLAQQIERTTKLRVERKLYLGGTLLCHEALTAGKIDTYVEYTGTAFTVVLKNEPINDPGEVYRRTREAYLSRFGVELAEPLGFNNTFAIIIRGETGTGKEVVARSVHRCSTRRSNRFVALNCSAIPETLLESELFGHEKGSFTGAHVQRKGRIESAAAGTLFLDEIGELPGHLNAQVLLALLPGIRIRR